MRPRHGDRLRYPSGAAMLASSGFPDTEIGGLRPAAETGLFRSERTGRCDRRPPRPSLSLGEHAYSGKGRKPTTWARLGGGGRSRVRPVSAKNREFLLVFIGYQGTPAVDLCRPPRVSPVVQGIYGRSLLISITGPHVRRTGGRIRSSRALVPNIRRKHDLRRALASADISGHGFADPAAEIAVGCCDRSAPVFALLVRSLLKACVRRRYRTAEADDEFRDAVRGLSTALPTPHKSGHRCAISKII